MINTQVKIGNKDFQISCPDIPNDYGMSSKSNINSIQQAMDFVSRFISMRQDNDNKQTLTFEFEKGAFIANQFYLAHKEFGDINEEEIAPYIIASLSELVIINDLNDKKFSKHFNNESYEIVSAEANGYYEDENERLSGYRKISYLHYIEFMNDMQSRYEKDFEDQNNPSSKSQISHFIIEQYGGYDIFYEAYETFSGIELEETPEDKYCEKQLKEFFDNFAQHYLNTPKQDVKNNVSLRLVP